MLSLLLKESGAASQAGPRGTGAGGPGCRCFSKVGRPPSGGWRTGRTIHMLLVWAGPAPRQASHAACVGIIAAVVSSLTAAASRKGVSGGVPKDGLLADDLISSFDRYLYP